ncbi:MAG: PEP-CTERM sorting domain-containing protein [Rubrivivax sp.]
MSPLQTCRIARRHLLAAAAACLLAPAALAAPITISTPFFNLEYRNVNSLGFTAGSFVRFGANSVLPNGNGGTTGVAIRDSDGLTRTLNFAPFPLQPNWFDRYLVDNAAYRGNWTLQFTNGSDVATAQVSLDVAAQQAPFVNSVTLSGTAAAPTFTWTPPPGATVNAYRVNLYEKLPGGGSSGNIASKTFGPGITSYTFNPKDLTLEGYQFQPGKSYSIEISLIQTKDGTSNGSNGNIKAIARSYADFTPQAGNSPVVNLPVVLANGSYLFNMTVVPGVTYYIDPEVAIGYDYATGAGDPNFMSVDLPDDIGDGLYDIYGYDVGGNLVLLAHDWDGADVYNFGPDGVDRFRVLGIETGAGLDPNSTTAFVTGLTFAGAGQFTGTQTPITVDVDPGQVPEPAGLAFAALGLIALLRRRVPQG